MFVGSFTAWSRGTNRVDFSVPASGRLEAELVQARAFHRQVWPYLDFMKAENLMGCHVLQERSASWGWRRTPAALSPRSVLQVGVDAASQLDALEQGIAL